MTVIDQVIVQTQQLAGEDGGELLNLTCRAAVSTLTAQLREGLTPEDCREDFITAASLYALGQWMGSKAPEPEFRAGDLTVKPGIGGSPAALNRQAMALLRPYCKAGFVFREV